MPSLDERIMLKVYNWVVNDKGWFKIMIPMLILLLWINIVTDGLECELTNIFQTSCEQEIQPEVELKVNNNKLGYCEKNKDCEQVCTIWSKSKSFNSLIPDENVFYTCNNGRCECQNTVELCSSECPW